MKQNKKVIYIALAYALFFLLGANIYVYEYERNLKLDTYKHLANEMKNIASSEIENKQKENTLISLSLSLSDNIRMSLLQNNNRLLNFDYLIKDISTYTNIEDIWIQLINTRGESFYRTWTTKTGDSLLGTRSEVEQILQSQKRSSFISTGKYSMTFKSMVPIFNGNEFLGIVESIVKFDSIVGSLKKKGYKSAVLVDKRYKEQLTNAPKNKFVNNYFIATENASRILLDILKYHTSDAYFKNDTYHIDTGNDLFVTTNDILSINNEPMGYLILAYPLNEINMSAVSDKGNKIWSYLWIFLILSIGTLYYLYTVQYKRFMNKQNNLLIDKVKEKTKSLQHTALHDPLTHLPNRIYLLKILQNNLREAKRGQESLYVLFLDIDRFKEVNDTFGHSVGDKLLKKVSKRLKESLREDDLVARVSGDEFVVILKHITREEVIDTLEQIIHTIQDPFWVEKLELFVSLSIGVSHFPFDGISAKVLLRQADTAMYKVKEEGKNNYQFYHKEMTEKALLRHELGRDLQKALINKEFEVYYQPKIDARSGVVLGLESLVRWNHPEKGLLSPDEFIMLAEEIGLIIQIDEYVRVTSFKQIATWQEEGLSTGTLYLNISTKQLESEYFLTRLHECVMNTGFNVDFLGIEVLENQIMKDIKKGTKILKSIKELGVKISVDDFGTGYSSLSYLQKLPIDTLKIDRSFVQNLFEDQSSIEIVKTIIALAKNLDLQVVAEGVENKEQLDCLLAEGCHIMQGYYFSKPLSAQDCKVFLHKNITI